MLVWRIRRLTENDLASTHEICELCDWRDSLRDLQRTFRWQQNGCLGAEADGKLIGAVTTIRYSADLAWIGYTLVRPGYRRQGVARSLMRAALADLAMRGVECVMLDASGMGRPLYEQLDFRAVHAVNTWKGHPSISESEGAKLTPDVLPAVIAYDHRRFGANRGKVLARLTEEFPEFARVDLDSSRGVRGYLLGHRRDGVVAIGPWLHDDCEGAASLLGSVSDPVMVSRLSSGSLKPTHLLPGFSRLPVWSRPRSTHGCSWAAVRRLAVQNPSMPSPGWPWVSDSSSNFLSSTSGSDNEACCHRIRCCWSGTSPDTERQD